MKWVNKVGKYEMGERLILNDLVCVGEWSWSHSSAHPDHRYQISTSLPTILPRITHYSTADEAKQALEAFVKRWIQKAGLHEKA